MGGRTARMLGALAAATLLLACGGGTPKTAAKSTPTPSAVTSASPGAPAALGPVTTAASRDAGIKDPANFGDQTVVAVPKAGVPVVAYTILDTNNDGNTTPGDDRLMAVAFDPSAKRWGTPIKIADAPMQHYGWDRSVAIAADPANGSVAVTWLDEAKDGTGQGVKVAFSTDLGKTWTTLSVFTGAAANPAIAMGGGKTYVAYESADSTSLTVATADSLSASSRWSTLAAPNRAGSNFRFGPSFAVDSTGSPYLAYYQDASGGGLAVTVWKVGGTPAKAMDSAGVQNDTAALGLAFVDGQLLLLSSVSRSTNGDDSVIFWQTTSAVPGTAWSAPAKVPPDTGESGPYGVSLASATGKTIAAYNVNSGGGSAKCNRPKLAQTTDLKTWATCSPIEDASLSVTANGLPTAAAGPDGALYIAFQNSSTEPGLPVGVLVWSSAGS